MSGAAGRTGPRGSTPSCRSGASGGRKRVARLMRHGGLEGAQRRRSRGTTRQDRQAVPAPDLVQRDFAASGPDHLWVADMTYVPTGEGWLYLATVLDTFTMAGWNRRPATGLVHHSDRGAQYTSLAFSRRCRDAGIAPSMGTVGDAYDNAMAEAFFATLETELLMRQTFATRSAARLTLFAYIEGFYNPRRRHSALGYLSPAEFERRWWAVQRHSRTRPGGASQTRSRLECPRIDSSTWGRHPATFRPQEGDADARGTRGEERTLRR